MGNSPELRMFVCSSETRTILVGIRGRHQHDWKEAKYGSHVEEVDETGSILENQHHFVTTKTWDTLNVNVNRTRKLLTTKGKCSNHEFLLKQLINYQGGRDFAQKLSRGPTTWKVIRKSALKDIVQGANQATGNPIRSQGPIDGTAPKKGRTRLVTRSQTEGPVPTTRTRAPTPKLAPYLREVCFSASVTGGRDSLVRGRHRCAAKLLP